MDGKHFRHILGWLRDICHPCALGVHRQGVQDALDGCTCRCRLRPRPLSGSGEDLQPWVYVSLLILFSRFRAPGIMFIFMISILSTTFLTRFPCYTFKVFSLTEMEEKMTAPVQEGEERKSYFSVVAEVLTKHRPSSKTDFSSSLCVPDNRFVIALGLVADFVIALGLVADFVHLVV